MRGARTVSALGLCGCLALGPFSAEGVAHAGLFDDPAQVAVELHASDAPTRREAVDKLDALSAEAARPYLEAALSDPDLEVRVRAVRSVGRHRLASEAGRLVALLGSPEPALRAAAAAALGILGSGDTKVATQAARPLERALGDSDHGVRAEVVAALGRMGAGETRSCAPALTARLEDENTTVRARAAQVLGGLGDRRAVIPLIGRLSDASREVRRAALTALGQLGDPGAAPAMLRLTAPSQPDEVRADAVQALGQLGSRAAVDSLIALFKNADEPLRGRAAFALAEIAKKQPLPAPTDRALQVARDPAIAALVAGLEREDARPDAREALAVVGAAAALPLLARLPAAFGEELSSIVELCGALHDRRATVPLLAELARGRILREQLVDALGQIAHAGDPRPTLPLLELLSDEDVAVRRHAAHALFGLTDARAESVLAKAARDSDREVRLAALGELERLRAKSAIPTLIAALASGDLPTEVAAARALGAIADPRTAGPLAVALDRPEERLRVSAADALGRLSPPALGLAPELMRRVRTGPVDRRPEAIDALAGVLRGRPNATARELLLDLVEGDDPSAQLAATFALGALLGPSSGATHETDEAVLRLVRRLDARDEPAALRRALITTLGELGGARATSALLDRLAHDPDPAVRAEAAWGLGKHALSGRSLDEAARALEQALASSDPALRADSAAALARLGRAPTALLRLLADPDPAVRADAAIALGRLPDARPALARLGSDVDPRVRAAATSALAHTAPAAPGDFVAIHVVDWDGAPLAQVRYRLTLPDHLIKLGETDPRGDVREESAPRGACALELLE